MLTQLSVLILIAAIDNDERSRELVLVAGVDDSLEIRDHQGQLKLKVHQPEAGRPYIHPIAAPDGLGVLTQFSPGHHPHQTGLYFGFLKVEGRDYFHNRGEDYVCRVGSPEVELLSPNQVRWSARYDWLDETCAPLLHTRQDGVYNDHSSYGLLDLTWTAESTRDVTFGEHPYGGLFLRMPWSAESGGASIDSEGHEGAMTEGARARWVEVGVPITGRRPTPEDWGRIAILDHPGNPRHPTPWRVDGQLGVGPAPSRLGTWSLPESEKVTFRYRLVISTGPHDPDRIEQAYRAFTEDPR